MMFMKEIKLWFLNIWDKVYNIIYRNERCVILFLKVKLLFDSMISNKVNEDIIIILYK